MKRLEVVISVTRDYSTHGARQILSSIVMVTL